MCPERPQDEVLALYDQFTREKDGIIFRWLIPPFLILASYMAAFERGNTGGEPLQPYQEYFGVFAAYATIATGYIKERFREAVAGKLAVQIARAEGRTPYDPKTEYNIASCVLWTALIIGMDEARRRTNRIATEHDLSRLFHA